MHHHALAHRRGTGRKQALDPLDLDHADAARADLVDILEIAKRRDLNAHGGRRSQDARMLARLDRDPVDR